MYPLCISFLTEGSTAFRAGSRHLYPVEPLRAARKTTNEPDKLVSQRIIMPDLSSTSSSERPRRSRRAPPGYISIGALSALTSTPRSILYFQVRNRELSACLWRGRIVVPETAVAELLAVK